MLYLKTFLWFALVINTTGNGYSAIAFAMASWRNQGDTAVAFAASALAFGILASMATYGLWVMTDRDR